MPKYYTMKDCFDACGDDDIPFNKETGFNTGPNFPYTKKDICGSDSIITIKSGLSDKWQIKRAEPKVLSAEEIWKRIEKKYAGEYNSDNYLHRSDLIKALKESSEDSFKNGQLREWMRPEQVELRETVKGMIDKYPHEESFLRPLKKAYYNLKQPNV